MALRRDNERWNTTTWAAEAAAKISKRSLKPMVNQDEARQSIPKTYHSKT